MVPVVFRPLAEQDLDALDDWIAADNPGRAQAFVEDIRRRCQMLGRFPEIGRRRDDIGPGIRTLSFDRRVLIAYRITPGAVEFGRILYRGRDTETRLDSVW